jgi:hypothetical protein
VAKPKSPKPAKTSKTSRKPSTSTSAPTPPDPTSDEALLALPQTYAEPPDIPVDAAHRELASLVRLAKLCAADLAKVGISSETIDLAARFAVTLDRAQKSWLRARQGVVLKPTERKLLEEAERLDAKLVAGGRWALRRDPVALAELGRIAEGSGLHDTVQDLRDLEEFWREHAEYLAHTLITKDDLARAGVLIDKLEPAAKKESADVDAARALDLRNRAFWAAHELAREIREGGRYAYADNTKLAAKFTSRYRTATVRRSRSKKAKRTTEAATSDTTA